MAAKLLFLASLLLLILTSSFTVSSARLWLPAFFQPQPQPSPDSADSAAPAIPAGGLAAANGTAVNCGGNDAAECVAAALRDLSSFHGASSRRVFSPRSVFMAPGAVERIFFSPRDKEHALTRLRGATFAVESLTSYRLLNSLYTPANHALVVLGSVHSSASDPESGSETESDTNGGKFIAFWDQIEGVEDDDCSVWGISWLMWQTRDEKRQTKRVPLTATISVDTSVIPNARAAELAAEQPAAQAAEGNEGLGEEPRQLDVFSKVQAAWTGSVSAIAADDVASASSILFGPDAVTLMAPGADSVTLATGKEKINLLNEFKASHVSLSVTVGEIAVLQDGDSKLNSGLQSYSALVRSNYTIANAQGVQVEQGKRMELWRPSAANGRDWHLSWSMWNDDGMCLARGK